MRRRWPLIAAAIVLAFVAFRYDKFFVQLYLRLTRPAAPAPIAKADPTPEAAPAVHVVDFVDTTTGGANLFVAKPGESFWQTQSPHLVKLRLGPSQSIDLRSFNTTIGYETARLSWLRLYPFPGPPRPYAEALAKVKAFVTPTKLLAGTDWARYDQALDRVPLSETFVPEAMVERAKVKLHLNCNWELGSTARAQLDRVTCLPHLSFEPR